MFKSSIFKNYEEIENYIYKTIEKAKSQEVVNKHYTYMGKKEAEEYDMDSHYVFITLYFLIFITFSGFRFSIFELDDEKSAPEIFETINARGMQLSAFDIIKNNLYKNFDKDNLEIFENNFEHIEDRIKSCYIDLKHADSFIFDFFKACYFDKIENYEKLKKTNLISNFDEIFKSDNSINNYNKTKEFIDLSKEYLDLYHELFKTNNFQNNKIKKIVYGLNILNYKTIKPILVSMLLIDKKNNNRNENNIANFIDKLYKYYLLQLNVEEKQANFLENNLKKIMVGSLKYKLDFLNQNKNNNFSSEELYQEIIQIQNEIDNYFNNINYTKIANKDYEANEVVK